MQQRSQQKLVFILELFPQEQSDKSFKKQTPMVELQLLNLLLLKTALKGKEDGVMITKLGHLRIGNT
jgi:hypothetical protein